jgi:hypothetical protein
MKKVFSDLWASFNTESGGASARKLSAFYAVVIVAGVVTHRHANENNAVDLVIVWLIFAAVCLGFVTAAQLIELRTGVVTKKELKITETETKEK